MVSPDDLLQFCQALDARRQRLLDRFGPIPADDSRGEAAWHSEIVDLEKQLGVASEELQVQLEQLEGVCEDKETAVAAYAAILSVSPAALVLTDELGAVIQGSRGLRTLTSPGSWHRTEPILSWFGPTDRSVVRTAMADLERTPDRTVELTELSLVRRDGTDVDVTASASVILKWHGRRLLLWTFRPVDRPQPPPDLPGPELSRRDPSSSLDQHASRVGLDRAGLDRAGLDRAGLDRAGLDRAGLDRLEPAESTRLTEVAIRLSNVQSMHDVVRTVLCLAAEYLPRAQALRVVHDRRFIEDVGTGDPLLPRMVALQRRLGEGPVIDALAGIPSVSRDLSTDIRWPRLTSSLPSGVGSLLAVPLHDARAVLVALDRADALDTADLSRLTRFGVHAGVAVSRAATVQELRQAIATRQHIGEAVGIVMERHRVTADQAFDLLVDVSQRANLKLRDVARRLVETGDDAMIRPERVGQAPREPRVERSTASSATASARTPS